LTLAQIKHCGRALAQEHLQIVCIRKSHIGTVVGSPVFVRENFAADRYSNKNKGNVSRMLARMVRNNWVNREKSQLKLTTEGQELLSGLNSLA